MSLKTLSVVGFVIMVTAIVAMFYRRCLLGTGPITAGVQVVAILLMIWARMTFGHRSFHAVANPTEGGLVTTGPYHYLRHPIYAAVLWFVMSGAAAHLSLESILLALVLVAGAALRIYAEERLVVQRYPEYVAYAARTPRVIPFLF